MFGKTGVGILVILFLVFGPGTLIDMVKTLSKAIKKFVDNASIR